MSDQQTTGGDVLERLKSGLAERHEAVREIEGLRALVKRLTDVAEDLASNSSDPGTEALAAIYCGRHGIYG